MNIVFLDIDGVMIPGRSYIGVKSYPPPFDPIAVQIVRDICDRCNARIVFNTMWSGRVLRDDLKMRVAINDMVSLMFDEKLENSITQYPYEVEDRLTAGLIWLAKNNLEKTQYVFLDDHLINHYRAIPINPGIGLTVDDYVLATEILGNKQNFNVIL